VRRTCPFGCRCIPCTPAKADVRVCAALTLTPGPGPSRPALRVSSHSCPPDPNTLLYSSLDLSVYLIISYLFFLSILLFTFCSLLLFYSFLYSLSLLVIGKGGIGRRRADLALGPRLSGCRLRRFCLPRRRTCTGSQLAGFSTAGPVRQRTEPHRLRLVEWLRASGSVPCVASPVPVRRRLWTRRPTLGSR